MNTRTTQNAAYAAPEIPGLDLGALRLANIARLPLFKNAQGEPAHSQADGSDWSLGDWTCAVTGELGELANIIKKVARGDFTLEQARAAIEEELADVLIYLDLLAFRCGVDMSGATVRKFNRTSAKVGADVVLLRHGVAMRPAHGVSAEGEGS